MPLTFKPMPRAIISGAAAIVLLLIGESLPGAAAQEQLETEPPAAFGTINSVDVSRRTINLSHEPMPDINWPPMLMEFEANPNVDLSQLRPGTRVHFSLTRDKNGTWIIDEITPIPEARRIR
ncbi:MAG: copper-binding protein [Beijerinckiaceae bacterium]|nr:copper-binding protein [Beijerinckiaceae bacterium]